MEFASRDIMPESWNNPWYRKEGKTVRTSTSNYFRKEMMKRESATGIF